MTIFVNDRGQRVRPCCDSTYDCTHYDDCPDHGVAARAALPCDIVQPDGWCFNHSTGHGAVYCDE